ncbi:GntR family transcriptional regulator [Pseudozobellia thermophila]|uniref:Transcriptional regulator, GntR family n=1 Tax=Pseudozobellia thermophila TaxID=192903 RepID=A0A1M6GDA9_9FLAO|nr:GntR family transcriptional regulator [Pseudozobellia thermophila]SHJ07912.1 transcriptional regulator, GntR family [Pseudozobellia thermophila]
MDFKLDQNSPVPLHAQIEEYLRNLIVSKDYKNGDKLLPKEVTMSKKLGVSRNTIRQAINKLVHEGLIERKKGVGTKVATKKISTRLDNWISFTKEMRNQGIEVVNYLVNVALVDADDEVYKALGVPDTKKIWKLEKIRGSKEAKYLYSISYFHPRVGITGNENFMTPLYELLEEEHDTIVSTSKEKLRAVMPDEKIASMLDIEKNVALLKRERLVTDIGDRPVEYNIVYYHTDYFTYDIDIKREL